MEPLTFSLIGFSLLQLAGEGASTLASAIGGGVAGKSAHDLAKISVRNLIARQTNGELPANHDLLRATRRAALGATYALARHYRTTLPAKSLQERWAELLQEWLAEEIKHTRRADYQVPSSPVDNRTDEILRGIEGDASAASSELRGAATAAIKPISPARATPTRRPSRFANSSRRPIPPAPRSSATSRSHTPRSRRTSSRQAITSTRSATRRRPSESTINLPRWIRLT